MSPVGIIGFGTFGRFLAEHIAKYGDVAVYDRSPDERKPRSPRVRLVSLEEVLKQPVIGLAVPVQELEGLLREIGPRVRPDALVVDLASVKTVPVELMLKYLPKTCDIVATHPLFGPQSARKGVAGLKVVTWPVRVSDKRYAELKEFLTGAVGLELQEVSPEEHDRAMAYVQSLTFAIGKALDATGLPQTELGTATYEHLLDIRRIVANDTPELFETIQRFNPYAAEVRQRFEGEFEKIERDLSKQ
jgi:prephenate dehydrogenase